MGYPRLWNSETSLVDENDHNAIVKYFAAKGVSYIARKNGDYYEAINGNTGKLVYGGEDDEEEISGIDAAAVINASINATTEKGGRILLTAGTYTLTSPLVLKSFVYLAGELESYLPTVTKGVLFNLASNVKGITIADTNQYCFGAENMSFNGNDISSSAIYITGVGAMVFKNIGINACNAAGAHVGNIWDAFFENVAVEYCNYYGWNISATGKSRFDWCTGWGNLYDQFLISGDNTSSVFSQLKAGRFDGNNGDSGIQLSSCVGANLISPYIQNCKRHGIRFYGATYCSIVNPIIINCSQQTNNGYDGINFASQGATHSINNLITNALISSNTTNKIKYGVNEADSNQNGNKIVCPRVVGAVTGQFNLQGTKSKVIESPTYVTQNKGYSTGTGAQQTIAHGCDFTPTESQVFLSERTTGGALAKQTAAPDATNIYVTATSDKDYNWKVEY